MVGRIMLENLLSLEYFELALYLLIHIQNFSKDDESFNESCRHTWFEISNSVTTSILDFSKYMLYNVLCLQDISSVIRLNGVM